MNSNSFHVDSWNQIFLFGILVSGIPVTSNTASPRSSSAPPIIVVSLTAQLAVLITFLHACVYYSCYFILLLQSLLSSLADEIMCSMAHVAEKTRLCSSSVRLFILTSSFPLAREKKYSFLLWCRFKGRRRAVKLGSF